MKPSRLLATLAGVCVLAGSQGVLADDFTYTFYDLPGGPGHDKVGASSSDTGAPSVDVSAWYGVANIDPNSLSKAYNVEVYGGGVGISSGNSGDQHTIDNRYNWKDYLVLDFGKLVSLSQVSLGYVGGYSGMYDSDFSVFYGDAGYNFASDAADNTVSLTESNFSLATHVNGTGTGNYDVSGATVDQGIKSSVWVIAAYSPVLGGSNALDERDDSFKLASIVATHTKPKDPPGDVPIPATFALMGLGGLLLRSRRNRSSEPQ